MNFKTYYMAEANLYNSVKEYGEETDLIMEMDILDFSEPFQRVIWGDSPPSRLQGNDPFSVGLPPGKGVWGYHVTGEPVFWVWRLWKDYGREPENAWLIEFDGLEGDGYVEDPQQVGAASPTGYAPGSEPPKQRNYEDMWEYGEDLIDWTVDMHTGPKEEDAPDPGEFDDPEMFVFMVKDWSDAVISRSFDYMFPEEKLGDSGILLTTRDAITNFDVKGRFDTEERKWV